MEGSFTSSTIVLKEEEEFSFKSYEYKTENGLLVIMQEHERPNTREKVSLNNQPVAGGKYRIGFMSYVIIKRSRVVRITMT